VLSGDASEVKGNPIHPYDYRPDFQLFVRAGGRKIGEGESLSENAKSYGFLEFTLAYATPGTPTTGAPTTASTSSTNRTSATRRGSGRLLIRGDLWSKLVGKNHSLALQQDFDYIDNEAYEFGGQSLGPTLVSRFELTPTLRLMTRAQAFFIILGAVNSNLSFLADVREPGAASASTTTGRGRAPHSRRTCCERASRCSFAKYRGNYINVSNGSILQQRHRRHRARGRATASSRPQLQCWDPDREGLRDRGWTGDVLPPQPTTTSPAAALPARIGTGRRTITQRNRKCACS
jgi:hypothetical protein